MSAQAQSAEAMKRAAARRALEFVSPGMRLGLGSGSTAAHFVDEVGGLVAAGMELICVPTSEATRAQAESLHIPLTTLDETPALDLTVDGADEIGPGLVLVKGGGGALLREKIVAAASRRLVIIADASKLVDPIGAFPLPVEVVPFGARATVLAMRAAASALGLEGDIVQRRQDGAPYVTDNGNLIFDCRFGAIADAALLADGFGAIPGVVEHGLFIGMADTAIIAGDGDVKLLGA